MNGDWVTFNRQPSLHRVSYMAHKVVVSPFQTFRFNQSVTTPYNADFDGDEMNMQVDRSPEAIVELQELMPVYKNILSTQNGRPIMGMMQDNLLGSRVLTMRDAFLTKQEFMQVY